ncbi:unnamed protein product, partial [Rotaria socialis]
QVTNSSQCQPSTCGARANSCSTNSDCECLALGSGLSGICVASLLPCSSLTSCLSDNVTCVVSSAICLDSTRCNKPMCYPLALTVPQVCPPLNSSATTSSVSTATTTGPTTRPPPPTQPTTARPTTTQPATTRSTTTTAAATPTTTRSTTTATPKWLLADRVKKSGCRSTVPNYLLSQMHSFLNSTIYPCL